MQMQKPATKNCQIDQKNRNNTTDCQFEAQKKKAELIPNSAYVSAYARAGAASDSKKSYTHINYWFGME